MGIRARIFRLTKRIVGEPLEIVIADASVTKPIVREPLNNLRISTYDFGEARVLVDQLLARCGKAGPRAVV